MKRAEISVLLNEIGEIEPVKRAIQDLFQQTLDSDRVEVAKDFLRQVLQLIEEKRQQISTLKNLIDDFRCNVLEEPGDRTIQAVNTLESYYTWQKTLMDYEEKAVMALRGNLFESVIEIIRSGTDEII
jgi:hypothetical protein